jgi:hypothetical protein
MGKTQGLVWALLVGMLPACGGGDGSSSGVDTGLPTTQKLSTLSDDEVKQVCHRVNEAATLTLTSTAVQQASCLSVGVKAGLTVSGSEVTIDVTKCQQAVDSCATKPTATTSTDDKQDCDSASAKDVDGCEATVGDYETCMNLLLGQVKHRLDELTCQNAMKIQSTGYDDKDPDPANIPQCQSIKTKCPDAELGLPTVN